MENKKFTQFILFWLSQSASQLGSAMTSYALIIWAYSKTASAMSVSLMAFCNFLPYVVVSIFAGTLIDRHNKKKIMLIADSIAAICSVVVLLLVWSNNLQIYHIYIVNGIIGFMNSFQSPAESVAIGILTPKDKIAKASGMESFSSNLIMVVSPVIATALLAFGGLTFVIAIDLITFTFAFIMLCFFIKITETPKDSDSTDKGVFYGIKDGMKFLNNNRGIWNIMLTMAIINFFSRISYENILSPMLLARSGGSTFILGIVNSALGIGGVIGGLIISLINFNKNSVKMIYFSAAISFLFGDLLMGMGRNGYVWCISGLMASLLIPFIKAGQNVIMYREIPKDLQGRVFSVRNAVQYSTIPIAILLGGFIADYIFEPFMTGGSGLAKICSYIVGSGTGSGMALMFICTGIGGFTASIVGYYQKDIKLLKSKYEKIDDIKG